MNWSMNVRCKKLQKDINALAEELAAINLL